jgi:hypothetical protein
MAPPVRPALPRAGAGIPCRAPKPAATPVAEPDGEAAFAPYRTQCLDLQRQMELRVDALRAHVPARSSPCLSPQLAQLAAMDAVMEQMLGERAQKTLAHCPACWSAAAPGCARTGRTDPQAWAGALQELSAGRTGDAAGARRGIDRSGRPGWPGRGNTTMTGIRLGRGLRPGAVVRGAGGRRLCRQQCHRAGHDPGDRRGVCVGRDGDPALPGATAGLAAALARIPQPLDGVGAWLASVPADRCVLRCASASTASGWPCPARR